MKRWRRTRRLHVLNHDKVIVRQKYYKDRETTATARESAPRFPVALEAALAVVLATAPPLLVPAGGSPVVGVALLVLPPSVLVIT